MTDKYSIKEVRVQLEGGATLIAEVDSVDGVDRLLQDIRSAGLSAAVPVQVVPPPRMPDGGDDDGPERRIELRAGLEIGALTAMNLLAFKDDVPQLLRPGALSVTDALLVLLFAIETGLRTSKVDYETFKDLYEAQNVKSGSPLTMKLTDLRNAGYLDKKTYQADKALCLTAKGERKAIEILKKSP